MCTRDLGVRQGTPRRGRQGALGTKKNCKKPQRMCVRGEGKREKNLLFAFCFKWYPKADARCQLWIPLFTNRLRKGQKKLFVREKRPGTGEYACSDISVELRKVLTPFAWG